MRILGRDEMRLADEATITGLAVGERAVMEAAGRSVAMFVTEYFSESVSRGVLVVCGSGKNGGDGYVVARALMNVGIEVWVLALAPQEELRGESRKCAESFVRSGGQVMNRSDASWEATCLDIWSRSPGLILDAIFGTGLSREIGPEFSESIGFVNALASSLGSPLVALDIPSGVAADSGAILGTSIAADVTLALQSLKPGHVLYPGSSCCGEVYVLDIGVATEIPALAEGGLHLFDEEMAQDLIQQTRIVSSQAHKGTRGHVLIVAGSEGHFGAAQLAAHAALATGAGLVTVLSPDKDAPLLSANRPEVMFAKLPDSVTKIEIFLEELLHGKDALVIGPGLGQSEAAQSLLSKLFPLAAKNPIPLLIDADALNLIAADRALRKLVPAQAILTPHPGEMARLLGQSTAEIQERRIEAAASLGEELSAVVLLKGARTITSIGSALSYINAASTAVLGTAGSGDVLSGVIGALLGQGLEPLEAASLGAFLHGAAGELLEIEQQGLFGLLATDIIQAIPNVMNLLLTSELPPPPRFVRRVLPGSFHLLDLQSKD